MFSNTELYVCLIIECLQTLCRLFVLNCMFDNTGFTLYCAYLSTLCRNTKRRKDWPSIHIALFLFVCGQVAHKNPNDKSVKLGDQSGDQRQKRGRLGCRLVEKLLLARGEGTASREVQRIPSRFLCVTLSLLF